MKTTRRTTLGMLGSLPAAVAEARAKRGGSPAKKDSPSPPARTPKLGVIYPFVFTSDMRTAITAQTGWGSDTPDTFEVCDQTSPVRPALDEAALTMCVQTLMQHDCTAIATVGSLRVYEILKDIIPVPFWSLVGNRPDGRVPRNCHGGVSLEIAGSTSSSPRESGVKQRRDFLVQQSIPAANIVLYRHTLDGNSAVGRGQINKDEKDERDSGHVAMTAQFLNSYDSDLNTGPLQVPSTTLGLLINASPVFLAEKDSLSSAVATWLRTPNRKVVYPLQDYLSSAPSGAICYGPSLTSALTILAGLARDGSTKRFQRMPHTVAVK